MNRVVYSAAFDRCWKKWKHHPVRRKKPAAYKAWCERGLDLYVSNVERWIDEYASVEHPYGWKGFHSWINQTDLTEPAPDRSAAICRTCTDDPCSCVKFSSAPPKPGDANYRPVNYWKQRQQTPPAYCVECRECGEAPGSCQCEPTRGLSDVSNT